MLTRKQMNLLLQQVIHSQAYQFWIQAKKEGTTWQEARVARLVVVCFKKPTNVWTSGFRDIVDQVAKGPTPRDTQTHAHARAALGLPREWQGGGPSLTAGRAHHDGPAAEPA